VAARKALQGALVGTMGGAHDSARTNREDRGTGHALAHVYAGRVLATLFGRMHSTTGGRGRPPSGRVSRWVALSNFPFISWNLKFFGALRAQNLDFIWRTFMTHHYVVSHGVHDVVARLSSRIPASQIHLGTPTTALLPDRTYPGRVSIACGEGEDLALHPGFEHVILATQANHAAPLIGGYARALQDHQARQAAVHATRLSACLAQFEYRQTVVVNHTDDRLLPADHCDRRDLNLVMVSSRAVAEGGKFTSAESIGLLLPPTYAMTTQILPRPAGRPPGMAILQTTNPTMAPRPASVLSVARLERALLTRTSKAAVRSLCADEDDAVGVGALQGAARRELGDGAAGLWVVGSYAHRGIPLLEGCVMSAREVVERGILRCESARVRGSPW
jgi:hypothetical protein